MGEAIFLDNLALDDVFPNNALEDFRRAGVVPGTLRIHHRDGAALTHAEAVHLGAINQRARPDEAEFLQSPSHAVRPQRRGLAELAERHRVGAEVLGHVRWQFQLCRTPCRLTP